MGLWQEGSCGWRRNGVVDFQISNMAVLAVMAALFWIPVEKCISGVREQSVGVYGRMAVAVGGETEL